MQTTNPSFSPLLATIVNKRNWASGLAMLGRGFSGYTNFLALVDALNPSGSFSVEDDDGIMRTAYEPRQEPVGIVNTVAQAGANLVITFTNPNLRVHREKIEVIDSQNNHGYVVSSAPGTITIQPSTSPLVLDSTLHFLEGSSVLAIGNIAGNMYSTGVSNLFKTVSTRSNYCSIMRESYTMARREKFTLYKWDEKYYCFSNNERDMVERFLKQKMWRILYSEPGQFLTPNEGVANAFQGLRAAVRDQGGRFISLPTVVTQAEFEGDLDWMAQQDPAQYQNFVMICGRRMWSRINSFYNDRIIYTNSKQLANGQSVNFDIPQVTINGVTMRVIVTGAFDDSYSFPTVSTVGTAGNMKSNTYAMLNLNPMPDKYGSMVPSVRKFHFAHSTFTGGAETLYKTIPGMTGAFNTNDTGGSMMGQYQVTGNSVDGAQIEILEDGGIDFAADACVWRELNA